MDILNGDPASLSEWRQARFIGPQHRVYKMQESCEHITGG